MTSANNELIDENCCRQTQAEDEDLRRVSTFDSEIDTDKNNSLPKQT